MLETLSPSSFATIAKAGSVGGSWTFPADWEDADDASYGTAPALSTLGAYTPYGAFTGFGLALASTDRVFGFGLRLLVSKDSGSARIEVDDVRLVQAGAVVGDNAGRLLYPLASKREAFSTEFDRYSLVIGVDQFNVSLLPADVNAADFGIAVSAKCFEAGSAAVFRLDLMRLLIADTRARERSFGTPIDNDDAARADICDESGLLVPASRLVQEGPRKVLDRFAGYGIENET